MPSASNVILSALTRVPGPHAEGEAQLVHEPILECSTRESAALKSMPERSLTILVATKSGMASLSDAISSLRRNVRNHSRRMAVTGSSRAAVRAGK
jgi:hypothetical protein